MELSKLKKEIADGFKLFNIDLQEVNILLCEALDLKLEDLFKIKNISEKQAKYIKKMAKKRQNGMPIQKIFKRAYFFEYIFFVNKNVLCPRPETELLVEECLKIAKKDDRILDLCTGSGVIAITIQKKLNATVFASDISKKALYVARKNAKSLGVNVHFLYSDMFQKIDKKFDIIVSNPPYIPSNDCKKLDREVLEHDPIISLDGGKDGLDFYRIISNNAPKFLNKNGKILLEVGIGEAKKVANMLEKNGFRVIIKNDYNNIERIVIGELL